MDFNGLVRHYYLRRGDHEAELRLNLVHKKGRSSQSHALALRLRDDLTALAQQGGARLKIVEVPPGPPVLSTIVAEVRGRADHGYPDLIAAAEIVRARLVREPGVVDVDDLIEADQTKLVFVTDKEKAALSGVSTADIVDTLTIALGGATAGLVHAEGERNPLRIELRLPEALRSSSASLARLHVLGRDGTPVPLAEIGRWKNTASKRRSITRISSAPCTCWRRPPGGRRPNAWSMSKRIRRPTSEPRVMWTRRPRRGPCGAAHL